MIDPLQVIADLIHVLSYVVLIKQIIHNKSVHEISYRTQEIYMIVYLMRYGDILWNRYSLYLTFMKLLYLGVTAFIIYLIKFKRPYCLGYDYHTDRLNHYMYIYPAIFVITLIVHSYSVYHPYFEFCWSYSVWLESVALIPQIYVIYQKKEVEVITGQYMVLVGAYKLLYVLKWIFTLIFKHHLSHWIKLLAAIVQIGVFADFTYYFYRSSKMGGNIIELPV